MGQPLATMRRVGGSVVLRGSGYVLEVMSPKSRMASLPSGVRIRLPGCGSDTQQQRESHRRHRVCQVQETGSACLFTCVEEARVEQLGEVGHHAHVHQVLTQQEGGEAGGIEWLLLGRRRRSEPGARSHDHPVCLPVCSYLHVVGRALRELLPLQPLGHVHAPRRVLGERHGHHHLNTDTPCHHARSQLARPRPPNLLLLLVASSVVVGTCGMPAMDSTMRMPFWPSML